MSDVFQNTEFRKVQANPDFQLAKETGLLLPWDSTHNHLGGDKEVQITREKKRVVKLKSECLCLKKEEGESEH